jgi:hypothetical protein
MSTTALKRPPGPYRRRARQTEAGIALPLVDHRTQAARRYRALLDSYAAELGGDHLTEPDKALVAQCAALQLRIEALQHAIVAGETVQSDEIIRLSSELRRTLTALRGKANKAKQPAGDALQAYLAERYPAKTEETPS